MSQLNGRMKLVKRELEITTGPGAAFVPLRPMQDGIEWEIIWAIGKQDDGAVVHGWYWYDPDNIPGTCLYELLGDANVPLPLGALDSDLPNVSMGPWRATWDRHPIYIWQCSGVGKKGTVLAIVIEHVGVEGLE